MSWTPTFFTSTPTLSIEQLFGIENSKNYYLNFSQFLYISLPFFILFLLTFLPLFKDD